MVHRPAVSVKLNGGPAKHPSARYLTAACMGHQRRRQQQLQDALHIAVVYMGMNGN